MMDTIEPTGVEATPEISRPHWGRALVWIALLALLALLALGLVRRQQGPVTIGEHVSTFTLTTFDGKQVELEDL